jgi:phospholipase C
MEATAEQAKRATGKPKRAPISAALVSSLAVMLMGIAFFSPAPPALAHSGVSHIVIIMEENKTFGAIVGNGCCPFINRTMIADGVLVTDDHAITSGSVHDYFALTDGLTTSASGTADNVFHQLQGAGISWKSYEESMPSPCYSGKSYGTSPNLYVKGHDPAMYYKDINKDPPACANVVPLDPNLSADVEGGNLPAYSFVVPNECNDMHSCSRTKGDGWLAHWVPKIAQAIGPDGVILLTWDEGSLSSEHVPLVEYGPGITVAGLAGTTYANPIDHYGELAGVEDNWGLARLNNAVGASALPIP